MSLFTKKSDILNWRLTDKYEFRDPSWSRYALSAFIYGNVLYGFGGSDECGEFTHDMIRFDVGTLIHY